MSGPDAAAWAGRRRNREAVLVLLALLVCAAGHASAELALAGRLPDGYALRVVGLGSLGLLAHLAVRRFAPYADPLVLPSAVLLAGLGTVLLSRLDHSYAVHYDAPEVAPDQVVWNALGVGVLAAVLAVVRHHRLLQRYPYLVMAAGMVLLMAPAFFGADAYGAKRWISVGPLSVQPGEFVKILIVIFFAGYLTANRDALSVSGRRIGGVTLPPGRNAAPVLVVWLLSLLVLVLERDLGTSLIFFGVFVIMLYAATERTGWVVSGVLLASVGAFVVGSLEPHVKGRVTAWLHPLAIYLPPERQPEGLVSDQQAEALFSFGTGGLTGTGLGEGQPWLIKFAGRSDFILTTVGEELGLLGTTLVILLYALLVERGLRTALAVTDPFGKLLALGLSVTLALQLFVVCGGVTGLVPLTGKALPFLAQGGSSTVANWLLVALLLKVSDSAGRASVAPPGNATVLTPALPDTGPRRTRPGLRRRP